MLSDGLVYTHSSGRVDSRASLLELLNSPALRYLQFEPSEVAGIDLGSVVILAGKVRIRAESFDRTLEICARYTSAYLQEQGNWRMVAWHTTVLQD